MSLEFTWGNKQETIEKEYDFSNHELELNRERSINPDATNNIIIEGDNLPALGLLQEDYKGKVKMIYIDPPYNTGNKAVYKDKYWGRGQCKHSAWLNMMYPRLKLARELLRDDGVIFVSIDDNEQANLKLLMDEVFGDENFINNIIWEKNYAPKNLNKFMSCNHDYIACYKKSIALENFNGLERGVKQDAMYKNPDNDIRGAWQSDNVSCMGGKNIYPITSPSGKTHYPPKGRGWVVTKENFEELKKDNRIWFGEDGNNSPRLKRFLSEVQQHVVAQTIWKYEDVGHTDANAKELKSLFDGESIFDFPKGTKLIKRMLLLCTKNEDIVLDFFAGSGTTGHAVMQMNLEEKQKAIEKGEDPDLVGNRKYIMVQTPEQIDEKSDAYKAGYNKISDITIDRIKRAGNKIKEDSTDVDTGFKVFELTETNFKTKKFSHYFFLFE